MEAQHTPGPWRVEQALEQAHDLWFEIMAGEGLRSSMIADCVRKRNAALIAAAPDLLYALKSAKWMLERDSIDPQKMAVIEQCEAAIAKATGETK